MASGDPRDQPLISELVGPPRPGSDAPGLLGFLRRHPIIVGTFVFFTLLGIVLGVFVLPEEWTLARRILGGAVGGAGCGLICTAPRIVG